MSAQAGPYLTLGVIGATWGLTMPLTRVAVATGYSAVGLIAWQVILMSLVLSVVLWIRGGRFPVSRRVLGLFLVVAFAGTLVPNTFSYRAAAHLPAGIMSIIIALVPMFALPIAIALGLERLRVVRLAGLLLGLVAIVLIAGPETSLPPATKGIWVLIAMIPPVCYGFEGNYLAWRGTRGLDPFEVLWGASIVAVLLAVPIALATGEWIPATGPWSAQTSAIIGIALCHAAAYSGYVWLVGRAGSVFAAQVAYVVTASGVIWSMLLLGERYSGWVWLAFGLMLIGVSLVQPRKQSPPQTT